MSKRRRFILNGTVLALSGILLRTVAVSFNAYVSGRIGAEGMGLFSLVMSVYGLAVTLAASGVNLASVRMTAEALADGAGTREIRAIMRRVLAYGCAFGVLSMAAVFLTAAPVGRILLADERCIRSLRIMAFGMPMISMSAAMAGYFAGVGRAYKNALIGTVEQAVRIALIIAGIVIFADRGVEWACFALVAGQTAAEAGSLAASYIAYLADRRRIKKSRTGAKPQERFGRARSTQKSIFARIFSIAMPVALGSYVRQGFTTAEHIAIPWGLRKNGVGGTSALERYGILHGMALPLVLYPSAVIGAFAGLLVPELAGISKCGDRAEVRRTASAAIRMAIAFSVGVAGVFSFYGYELGISVYSSGEAGRYIRMLAPLVPMMFLDTTVDSVLKGLDEQIYTMKVNIIDAAICLIFVLLLVPRMGIMGYIVVIYVSEAVNAALSIDRMQQVTGIRVRARMLLVPGVFAFASHSAVRLFDTFIVFRFGRELGVAPEICAMAALYAVLCFISAKAEKQTQSKKSDEK